MHLFYYLPIPYIRTKGMIRLSKKDAAGNFAHCLMGAFYAFYNKEI